MDNITIAEARQKGYAETDPALDVEGIDSAHKLAILCALGFAADFHYREIHVEGIADTDPADIACAAEMGYTLKLLAIGKPFLGSTVVDAHIIVLIIFQRPIRSRRP